MLEEHFRGDGDDEGGVVAAVADVVIGRYDLLYAGDYELECQWVVRGLFGCGRGDGRGSATVPVTSLDGVMGVLL